MKKTVTIFRYPVSGANYDIIEARYRGVTLNWYKNGRQESAQKNMTVINPSNGLNSKRSVSDSRTLSFSDGMEKFHLRAGNSNVS